MNLTDTIAAVSTPRGKGGIAVLRISGDEALTIADKVFRPKSGAKPSTLAPRLATYGDILSPLSGKNADGHATEHVIDSGMITCFHAPHSFTGENTVEISCHGGMLVTEEVLGAILVAGARPAEAGEFTRRSFVNGKMDLSRAEALSTLLEAQTRGQLALSRAGMQGILSDEIRRIYEDLRSIVGSLYAGIDFPDEDLATLPPDEILTRTRKAHGALDALCRTYSSGKAVNYGIRTVICGRTNAGKSSLYNRLVGHDAAIVTDIAGTTRDVLEENVSVGPVLLRLCDTAGLRESADRVEAIGIEKARAKMKDAELILAVFDASSPFTDEDAALVAQLSALPAATIAIMNKSDLLPRWDAKCLAAFPSENILTLSTGTGDGFAALCARIQTLFFNDSLDLSRDPIVANARQYAALCKAREHLSLATDALENTLTADVACTDLELAMSSLAEIDGRAVTEDIVSEIFSHFCVGK